MTSAFTLIRRGLVVSVLTLALALMHGGIGQAMACTGMNSLAVATSSMPVTMGTSMSVDESAMPDMSEHHQPGHDPAKAHTEDMCVSTPAKAGGGGSKGGSAAVIALVSSGDSTPDEPLSVTAATGRHPPAPDLISVLCVIRQ